MDYRRAALLLMLSLVIAPAAAASPRNLKMQEGCIRAEPFGFDRILAESPPGPLVLSEGSLMVRLSPVCAGPTILPRGRVLLVIDDLRARAQPGVLYDLRLGDAGTGGRGALIGNLNFFAAQHPGVPARPRRVSYDVTEALHILERAHRGDGLVLTIAPQRAPQPGGGAAIGRILLVEQ